MALKYFYWKMSNLDLKTLMKNTFDTKMLSKQYYFTYKINNSEYMFCAFEIISDYLVLTVGEHHLIPW